MAEESPNRPGESQNSETGGAGNWLQETERELRANAANTAPTFGETDGTDDAERQALLHQGTAQFQKIEEEAPAPADDRPAPDETVNHYTEINPPSHGQWEFTSLQQIISPRGLPGEDPVPSVISGPQARLPGDVPAAGVTVGSLRPEQQTAAAPQPGGSGSFAETTESGPETDPVPVQPGPGPDPTPEVPVADEAPEGLALDSSTVAENAAGAAIGTLSATDPEGGAVSFTVDDARFEVQGDGTLKLKDGISLNFEAEPSVTVTITATDAGGNSTDQAFTLTVTDADEAPEGLALDSSTVAENAAGAAIGTLSATDPEGGAVSFTVDDARFEVQGDGTLKLKDGISLNFEAEPSVTVTITATDAGGNSTDQAFTLTVTDADEAPEGLALDSSTVAENAAGAAIGTLSATDPEGGAVSFTVDDARFEVQGDGTLKLKDGISLDFEAEPSVTVTITATDAGGNSTDQAFNISVIDIPVTPATVTVSTSFHVEQIAVVDGVLNILDIDYNSDPLDEIYTQTIDFPSTPFTFFDALSPDVFATKVTGRINIDEAGSYEFRLTTGDTAIVWIDGESLIVKAVEGVATVELGGRALSAGEHEIVIHHLDQNGDAEMTFEWRGPGETDFSLVTPSPYGSIENNDDAGFIIDVDTGTSALEAVKLTNVPDNWVFRSGEETAVASGGEVDITGWDLSQLVIAPASDDLGVITLDLETTLRSADGEVETSTSSFDVNVVPEDGIVLDLDIDLGILAAGVDLSSAAAPSGIELAANALLPVEDLAASLDATPVTPVDENGSPALF
ncbi:PA14 domain-containing protein [Phaeobacter inhibens]|uniref:PA14 domain-containing protein n=1 Tax=Phaeobacter inhibens TaxID=221822 RepID=UPI000C9A6368|nr:PA14 domain-containing protein [Phaeobacter inhibens]AUQ67406.1 PA14 domain protein [Phaeobacter inhibens]